MRAGESLPSSEWAEIRERAIFELCKWDVQCEDHSVLARFPLLIDRRTAKFVNEKAEALTREALAAEEEILERPRWMERLALPSAIRRALERVASDSTKRWRELRIMRFDFHLTRQGWRISEVNADVPGGFIEASGWNALFGAKWSGACAPADTAEIYSCAIRDVVGTGGLVALVHATAYSDDRQVMMYLRRRFAEHGMGTCLCGPAHLRWNRGYAEFCGSFTSGQPGTVVRFFPAEWLPNVAADESWRPYLEHSQTPISNPGSAILLQTKRFPLIWDELETDLSVWRELLPETREVFEAGELAGGSWVLKPALGRVGEGIGIRGITPDLDFARTVAAAQSHSRQWIAQKRFETLPVETENGAQYPCIGVFTIGGKAAGFYGRISASPIIDRDAQDVAVLISEEPEMEGN